MFWAILTQSATGGAAAFGAAVGRAVGSIATEGALGGSIAVVIFVGSVDWVEAVASVGTAAVVATG